MMRLLFARRKDGLWPLSQAGRLYHFASLPAGRLCRFRSLIYGVLEMSGMPSMRMFEGAFRGSPA